jgi:hypothetical protein
MIPTIPEPVTSNRAGNLNFQKRRIEEILANPDGRQEINGEGIVVEFLTKRTAGGVDVVATAKYPGNYLVAFALHAFDDFPKGKLADMTPLEVVRQIAERFGLEQRIGDAKGRFFVTQMLDRPKKQHVKLIDVINPADASFISQQFVRTTDLGIDICLAFCLNTDAYRLWVDTKTAARGK